MMTIGVYCILLVIWHAFIPLRNIFILDAWCFCVPNMAPYSWCQSRVSFGFAISIDSVQSRISTHYACATFYYFSNDVPKWRAILCNMMYAIQYRAITKWSLKHCCMRKWLLYKLCNNRQCMFGGLFQTSSRICCMQARSTSWAIL